MKAIDFIQSSLDRTYFVGANGSGKTYHLKKIYNQIEDNALFFDEKGRYLSNKTKANVEIQDERYIFLNEKERGKKELTLNETEKMNKKSINIVSKINNIKTKLILQKKSAGIDKINGILNQLLSKNLNNIENIIFDEPENFLDETNLKYLVDIFSIFKENNIKVFISTHSSRFLELSAAKVNEIFVLSFSFESGSLTRRMVNNSLPDIKKLYTQTRQELEEKTMPKGELATTKTKNMFAKICLSEEGEVLDLYLRTLIEDNEFYKILFYKKIILVEGLTEKLILSKVPDSHLEYMNFYFSSGKIHIPFLIELFKMFGLNVIVMFDSDLEEKVTLAKNITDFLKSKYETDEWVTLIPSTERDLEADYNIELIIDEFSSESGLSRTKIKNVGYFKPYKALYAFEKDPTKYDVLVGLLNPMKKQEESYQFS